jgi:hypothetical protein
MAEEGLRSSVDKEEKKTVKCKKIGNYVLGIYNY